MLTRFGKSGYALRDDRFPTVRSSGPARIIARGFIDLGGGHLPGDISHLLADVVAPAAGGEGLQLRLDVDGRLSIQPWRTEFGI